MTLKWIPAVTAIIFLAAARTPADAHCQIPCGIYNDTVRFTLMREHVATIEKSMQQINQIEQSPDKAPNQLVRWVINKENHADELAEIITYYFMTQRIKPADAEDPAAFKTYQSRIITLHKMLIATMKSKQSTQHSYCDELNKLITEFETEYLKKSHD